MTFPAICGKAYECCNASKLTSEIISKENRFKMYSNFPININDGNEYEISSLNKDVWLFEDLKSCLTRIHEKRKKNQVFPWRIYLAVNT